MPPPSKEQEVLERQRRLAASMKQQQKQQQKQAATTRTQQQKAAAALKQPQKKPALKYKRPSSASSPQQPALKRPASAAAVLAAARSKARPSGSTAATSTTGSSAVVVDLAKKSPSIPRQVKAKAASSSSTNISTNNKSPANNNKNKKPTAFSSLVKKSAVAATTSASSSSNNNSQGDVDDDYSSFNKYEPDDFWKHLRDWDFLAQVYLQLEQQKQPNKTLVKRSGDADTSTTTTRHNKAIPELFLNARHYVAAWAPLCLAETRAQVLSEWLNDLGSGRVQRGGATVTAVLTDNHSTYKQRQQQQAASYVMRLEPEDSVCLKLSSSSSHGSSGSNGRPQQQQQQQQQQRGSNNNDLSFITNDIVLLVPVVYKDLFISVLNGNFTPNPDETLSANPFKKWGILVGHAKCTRKTPHDLIVQVSKRKWAMVPTSNHDNGGAGANKNNKDTELWLWKLGSNVTALREFTALCRMDHLPLKRFLLGHHLDHHHHKHPRDNKANTTTTPPPPPKESSSSKTKSEEDLLEKIGGSQALGKGFTDYARQKFNSSQLGAIVASAHEYGEGGFTLIKGPPGTGKTTTLVAVLNSLHIRQFNKYYEQVREIAKGKQNRQFALELARKSKPRLLVCAPSNAAIDHIILKIIEDGFVDGQGKRYSPSMIRIGVGQSGAVRRAVSLEQKVDAIFSDYQDVGALEGTINKHKKELQFLNMEITKCRRRVHAIEGASPWPLSKDWEIRVDEESFDQNVGEGKVYFVNHRDKSTTFEVPPPPEPGEHQYAANAMPEYRALMSSIVSLVEQCFRIKTQLERCTIVKGSLDSGAHHMQVRQSLEQHVLNGVHITMTTLGTAGSRTLEGVDKFEVVVVDEAAQSVEPATLSALQLGSRHCVLVGDPQQLPATIFNVSGKTTKYDRSLFQRLEEAKQPVHMLEVQYRMHPMISHFPRHIFYDGNLRDGPNVLKEGYGNPLRQLLAQKMPLLQPFTVLDLDSKEERGGTSLANSSEAHLAVHLYNSLNNLTGGFLKKKSKVAIITPYAQQTRLLHRTFENALGPRYETMVEVNTVDAYQGREANVVIFSAVRAAGSHGIGFLSDVRRMNVALTRAKHFLFVIARCQSIVVNPYWNDLVEHARENQAVLRVPIHQQGNRNKPPIFGNAQDWQLEDAARPYANGSNNIAGDANFEDALADLASLAAGKPMDPRRGSQAKQPTGNSYSSSSRNNNNAPKPVDPRRNNENQNTQQGKDNKPKDPREGNNKKRGNRNKRKDPRHGNTVPRSGTTKNGDNASNGAAVRLDPRQQITSNPTSAGGQGYNIVQSAPPPPPPPPRPPPPPPPRRRPVDPRQKKPTDPRRGQPP